MDNSPVHLHICQALGTFITPSSHPSCRGNPYSNKMWQIVIKMWQNGDDLQSPTITHLQEIKLFPHIATFQAWIKQFTQVGNVDSKKTTGNHHANCVINDKNLVWLAIYCSTNPKATIDGVCVHLFKLQNSGHQSSFLPITCFMSWPSPWVNL